MSKKRDRHLIASEAHGQKHKEMREFRNEYVGWAGSSAGWPWFRGFIGKTRLEFQNGGCIKSVLSVLGWVIFVLFIVWCFTLR